MKYVVRDLAARDRGMTARDEPRGWAPTAREMAWMRREPEPELDEPPADPIEVPRRMDGTLLEYDEAQDSEDFCYAR